MMRRSRATSRVGRAVKVAPVEVEVHGAAAVSFLPGGGVTLTSYWMRVEGCRWMYRV